MKYLLLCTAIAIAGMSAAWAADDDPITKAVRFQPSQRVWQCNDIRVTETVMQPGVVTYDLGGTIWGGSQFTLNIQQGALFFNGRPCYRY
jgi:hypothetical protein